MGVYEHAARTRSDRLVQSMDALTAALRELLERLPTISAEDTEAPAPNIMLLANGVIMNDIRRHGPISGGLAKP